MDCPVMTSSMVYQVQRVIPSDAKLPAINDSTKSASTYGDSGPTWLVVPRPQLRSRSQVHRFSIEDPRSRTGTNSSFGDLQSFISDDGLGIIDGLRTIKGVDTKDQHILEIHTAEGGYNSGRTYFLAAANEEERDEWVELLKMHARRAAKIEAQHS
eukprot:331370-Rhodomonas_salina.2